MKIYIAHNSRPIVFYKNTKFRFASASPIFSSDGATTFPFNIPVDENRVALDFCEKLEISATLPGREINPLPRDFVAWSRSAVKIPVIVDSKLFDYKTGYLFVTPGNEEYICTLVVGQGKFNNDVTGRLLSELCDIPVNMGSDIDDFIDAANIQITKDYPEVDFNFPIMKIDQAYTNETLNQAFKFINYFKWWLASPTFAKNDVFSTIPAPIPWFPDLTYPSINNYTSYVPCPFVFAVLKNIINNIGYHVIGNCFSDASVNQLMFIINKSIDKEQTVNLSNMVKVGRSSDQENIFPVSDWPYPAVLNFNKETPLPFQNPNGIFVGNIDYVYPGTVNAVGQVHYELKINNTREVGDLKFKMCIAKHILDPNQYTQWISPADDTEYTVPAGGSITVSGSMIFPATPGMNNICLAIQYLPPYPDELPYLDNDISSICDWIIISDHLTVQPKTSFNLKDMLPAITLKTILDDLKNLFGIVIFTDNSDTIYLEYFKDIAASIPVLDLTPYLLRDYEKSNTSPVKSISFPSGFSDSDLSFITAYTFTYSTIKGALQFYPPDGHYFINDHDEYYTFSWSRHLPDLSKMIFDVEDGEDISINAALPEIIVGSAPSSSANKGPMPYLQNNLISPFNGEDNAPEYKLAFWRGLIADAEGETYPFATPYVYDINSLIYQVDLQLKLNGDYGLYQNYLEPLISILNAENNIFKVEMNLPENILLQLRYNKRYTAAGIPIIIKSIDFEFDQNDEIVQPVTLEIVKC